jgi:hypothetical protein
LSEVWRNLIVSVSVLALSGVSYLAFAEPPLYGVLFLFLVGTMTATYVVGAIWSGGVLWTAHAASKAVTKYVTEKSDEFPPGAWREISDVIYARTDKMQLPAWVFPVFFLLNLYLAGLLAVPVLREKYEKPTQIPNQLHDTKR